MCTCAGSSFWSIPASELTPAHSAEVSLGEWISKRSPRNSNCIPLFLYPSYQCENRQLLATLKSMGLFRVPRTSLQHPEYWSQNFHQRPHNLSFPNNMKASKKRCKIEGWSGRTARTEGREMFTKIEICINEGTNMPTGKGRTPKEWRVIFSKDSLNVFIKERAADTDSCNTVR